MFVSRGREGVCGCWWATSCASWLSEKGPQTQIPPLALHVTHHPLSHTLSLSLSLSQTKKQKKNTSLSSAINYINQKPPKNQIHLPLSLSLSSFPSFKSITLSLSLSLSFSLSFPVFIYRVSLSLSLFGFVRDEDLEAERLRFECWCIRLKIRIQMLGSAGGKAFPFFQFQSDFSNFLLDSWSLSIISTFFPFKFELFFWILRWFWWWRVLENCLCCPVIWIIERDRFCTKIGRFRSLFKECVCDI